MIGRPRSPLLWGTAGFVAALGVAAAAAPWLAPADPLAPNILARLRGPGLGHLLGTDQFGRDLLSRILFGMRASLIVSGASVGAALLLGGTIGLAAAWQGGWLDRILMRSMDVLFAFPVLLLAIAIVAILGPGATSAAVAIGVVYTPVFARLLRGPALVVIASDHVEAARSIGAGTPRILLRHVLPGLASVVLVQTSLLLSTAILVEASLSFLGLGTAPPSPSLGLMLAEGRNFLMLSPWAALFPGFAILLLAFGLNLLGDVLRDRLDPRLRSER